MINIGALTDAVIAHLSGEGLLIGDGIAPKESGWTQGSPNVDRFIPCTVIGTEAAVPSLDGLGMLPEWEVAFTLRHYGGARRQCDFQAHAARVAFQSVDGLSFGDPVHRIIRVRWSSLGGLVRLDQLNPPFWQAYDQVAVMCSR